MILVCRSDPYFNVFYSHLLFWGLFPFSLLFCFGGGGLSNKELYEEPRGLVDVHKRAECMNDIIRDDA